MISTSSLQHPHDLMQQTHAIELFAIPQELLTRTTILPDAIETFTRAEKRTLTEPDDRAAFFAALEAAKPSMGQQASEFRIKAVLLGSDGARIGELYASAQTPFGMLGDDVMLKYETQALARFVLDAVKPAAAR